ncbi:MAG: xanthine dehydrogenase family protein molybdopterin-binding subunit [Egibacteraceae bacterium]
MTVREREDRRGWRDVATRGALLGEGVAHHDFVDKVRGSMPYADDWQMPGMLFGIVVRAQRPSATIRSIDCAQARQLPGVVAVLTAEDVPANSVLEEASGLGVTVIETPVLAHTVVRYEGEPVALVAAESPDVAELAAELIVVDYIDRPAVFDPEEALKPAAPRLHGPGTVAIDRHEHAEAGASPELESTDGEDTSNVLIEWALGRGDVVRGLDEAEVVVAGTYRTHRVDHAYLEPEAGVGWIESDGVVVLRVSTQVIEHAREVAEILKLPHNKVRVIGTYMGGGFGGKEDMTVEPYLALLVHKTRRPVKMVWSRQESILARVKRHPIVMRYRTGAKRTGEIVAQDIDLIGDAGAYPHLSPRVMFAAAVVAAGPYRTPNTRVRSRAVFTNNVPTSAFRGFGAMQVTLGYEGQIDLLAGALELPADEVRRRNFLRKGDTLPTGEDLDTAVALPATLSYVRDELGERPRPSQPHRRVGRGVACNMQPYGRAVFFADQACCWMSLEPDGGLVIRAGVTDLGGGQAASLCQIAGEVLGIALDAISVHIADTALTPPTGGTYATRQLYMSGNAALKTAVELRDKLAEVAADLLEATAEELEFTDGTVSAASGGKLSLSDLVTACKQRGIAPSHLGVFNAEGGEFNPQSGEGRTFPDFTYGTHGCDVEVDPDTGEIRIQQYVACHDVGKALNPLRVTGQIEGGAVQGIGYALSEEVAVVDGTTQSTLFADYLIPAASDLPDIRSHFIESGEGKGPFNARGIGEPPIGPPAAALASAIEDAVGVRLTELPFKPERVLEALARQAAMDGPGP